MEIRTAEEIGESTQRLLKDLKAAAADSKQLLRAGARASGELGGVARERLAAALEAGRHTQARLQECGRAGARLIHRQAHEHPYQALGMAFGFGLVVGVLLNRK